MVIATVKDLIDQLTIVRESAPIGCRVRFKYPDDLVTLDGDANRFEPEQELYMVPVAIDWSGGEVTIHLAVDRGETT